MDRTKIEGSSIVSWSSSAVATEVNDEIVLMSMERNRCYGLGATGTEIWRKLASPIRVTEVIADLKSQYEAEEGTLESDVLRTLNELQDEGLVQVHSNH